MAKMILETPVYSFTEYMTTLGMHHISMVHKTSKRGVMLTSGETECFLVDFNNWREAMSQEYLAAMLWEAHAAPILGQMEKESV